MLPKDAGNSSADEIHGHTESKANNAEVAPANPISVEEVAADDHTAGTGTGIGEAGRRASLLVPTLQGILVKAGGVATTSRLRWIVWIRV